LQYLWTQQADDGGFHSSTYGLLRSGQSLTPFVLDAMLTVPESLAPSRPADIDRALAFIKKNTNGDGSLGLMDETAADNPNYATSLAVMSILKAMREGSERDIEPMVANLVDQQFGDVNGWKPEDAPLRRMGMGGPIHRPPDAGHVDLSMTRCVLEALRHAGIFRHGSNNRQSVGVSRTFPKQRRRVLLFGSQSGDQ
jgi:hypothetical protein